MHARSVSCCFLFVCLISSSPSPPAACSSHYSCWCPKRLCLEVSLFLCPFFCVSHSHSHLCLTSHRDQWSRAAVPHHEGRAAQVPPRKLRCLQIRHQPPEQVRYYFTTSKLHALRYAQHVHTGMFSSLYKRFRVVVVFKIAFTVLFIILISTIRIFFHICRHKNI